MFTRGHGPETLVSAGWIAHALIVPHQRLLTLLPCMCVWLCCPAGLDLIWRIYLGSQEEGVAHAIGDLLLNLYHCRFTPENCHVFRNALVK